MKVIIEGSTQEIADLVLVVQGQQAKRNFTPEASNGFKCASVSNPILPEKVSHE